MNRSAGLSPRRHVQIPGRLGIDPKRHPSRRTTLPHIETCTIIITSKISHVQTVFSCLNPRFMFELFKTDPHNRARLGRLTTPHGVIDTPTFMPVGTQGSVKALDPRELREMNTQVILGK